jgi:hypothetical protein
MTQHPNSFLQPESQPWSRSIEQRLNDLENNDRLNRQESNNNLSQINSSNTLISGQVSLLSQMRIYSQTSGSAFQTAAGTVNYTNPASVTFTVDRPMQVLLQLIVPIAYVVNGGDEVQAFVTYSLTGPGASGTVSYLFRTGTPGGENGANQGLAVARGLVGAGTHTFARQNASSATLLLSGGSPGIHFVSGSAITAIATVTGAQSL